MRLLLRLNFAWNCLTMRNEKGHALFSQGYEAGLHDKDLEGAEATFSRREVALFDAAWDLVVAVRGGGPMPEVSAKERSDQAAKLLMPLVWKRNDRVMADSL